MEKTTITVDVETRNAIERLQREIGANDKNETIKYLLYEVENIQMKGGK